MCLNTFSFFLSSYITARGEEMIHWDILKDLLLIASCSSTICVAFIQKIKKHMSCSKKIPYYSFFVNIIVSVLFCFCFTNILFPMSLWVGFFSYIGADTIYKTLEGKLANYTTLTNKVDDTSSLEEITYE